MNTNLNGRWVLVWDQGGATHDPEWTSIREAVEAMDGVSRTVVALAMEGYGTMTAGGGNGGKHIVIFTFDNPDVLPYTLTDPSQTGSDVELYVEGVASDYPAKWAVNKDAVIDIFRRFFTSGILPTGHHWEIG